MWKVHKPSKTEPNIIMLIFANFKILGDAKIMKTSALTPSKYKSRPLLSQTYMFDFDVNVWS